MFLNGLFFFLILCSWENKIFQFSQTLQRSFETINSVPTDLKTGQHDLQINKLAANVPSLYKKVWSTEFNTIRPRQQMLHMDLLFYTKTRVELAHIVLLLLITDLHSWFVITETYNEKLIGKVTGLQYSEYLTLMWLISPYIDNTPY